MHAAPRSATLPLALASALIVTSLTACGGGGGSSTAGTTTPAAGTTKINDQTATAELSGAYSASSSLYNMGSSSTSMVTKDAGSGGSFSTVDFALRKLDGLLTAGGDAGGLASKAVGSATVACSGGGTVGAVVDDADNSGAFSTGDSAVFTFTGCREGGMTMSGRMTISQVLVTGSVYAPSYSVGATFSFESLSASGASQPTVTINGGFSLQAAYTTSPAAVVSATITGTAFSATTSAGIDTLSDFAASVTVNATTNRYQYGVSGREADSATNTAITITNPVPFQGTVGTYPSSGSLRVQAADGSAARLTATSATSVIVDVDANGDGTYESSSTRTWAQIAAGS